MKPYYDHGGITIFNGDCRDVLPSLGKFDLLLTDPPYGIGLDTAYKARGRDGSGTPRLRKAATARDHVPVHGDNDALDPGILLGSAPALVLWGANNYASKLVDTPCWLVWDRKSGGGADCDVTDCELAAVYGHRFKTVRIFRHLWVGFQRASETGQAHLHPTQKPVALMRWCLSFFPEARTVVDPYMGSGPVARACKDAGLRYVGIEIEERYCEIATRRLAQEVLF